MSFKSGFVRRAIFWRNLVGAYCVGLDRFAPVKVVACSDHGVEQDAIREETGIRFYALEEYTRERLAPIGHQHETEGESALIRVLHKLPKDTYAIASPVPSRMLSEFIEETGFVSASAPYKIADWLSEKCNWFTGLDHLKLPRLPGRWMHLRGSSWQELRHEFGETFVAQLSRGVSGSGTAVIGSEAEYAAALKRLGDDSVWVAPFKPGPSIAINAVAFETGTAVGYPSVQIVGRQECNALPGSYCGNDYAATAALPRPLLNEIQEQTERIGEWMASLGFRGIFGLDFVMDEDMHRAYAIDLNPRWLGSTALFAQAEEAAGRTPLAALDLAGRLGALSEAEALEIGAECRKPVKGSQLILYSGAEFREISETPRAGVCGIDDADVEFLREGIRLGDCANDNEFLLTCGVPRAGLKIEPRSHLFRIYSHRAVLDERGDLLPWCRDAIRYSYWLVERKSVAISTQS